MNTKRFPASISQGSTRTIIPFAWKVCFQEDILPVDILLSREILGKREYFLIRCPLFQKYQMITFTNV